jgi:hypothetical protein
MNILPGTGIGSIAYGISEAELIEILRKLVGWGEWFL